MGDDAVGMEWCGCRLVSACVGGDSARGLFYSWAASIRADREKQKGPIWPFGRFPLASCVYFFASIFSGQSHECDAGRPLYIITRAQGGPSGRGTFLDVPRYPTRNFIIAVDRRPTTVEPDDGRN